MPFCTVFKLSRFHATGAEQEVNPFHFLKTTACLNDFILVQARHLNRCDIIDDKRALLFLIFVIKIGEVNNTPNTSRKKLIIFSDIFWLDIYAFYAEEKEISLILVNALIQL